MCLRSKAVWGYNRDFMEACRPELTFRLADMSLPGIQAAEIDGRIVGVVEVTARGAGADLAKLFVEPAELRSGIGRHLFEWATATARASGARTLTIDADPGAANFYRRMGAIDDGVSPSGSISGRFLPRLVLPL